jgi:hypothetical protein
LSLKKKNLSFHNDQLSVKDVLGRGREHGDGPEAVEDVAGRSHQRRDEGLDQVGAGRSLLRAGRREPENGKNIN